MLLRKLIVWWAGLLTVIGGLLLLSTGLSRLVLHSWSTNSNPVQTPHPRVVLTSAQLCGGPTFKPRERVVVKAYTNTPTQECTLHLLLQPVQDVSSGAPYQANYGEIRLRDDGTAGDPMANDGEWYGEWVVIGSPPPPYSIEPMVEARFTTRSRGGIYDSQYQMLPEIHIRSATASPEHGARVGEIAP